MGKELGLLEKLEMIIPGFRGYKKKELIREDDILIRRYIYSELAELRDRVRKLQLRALDGRYAGSLTLLDRIWKSLDLAASKIRSAPAGYAGLFDRVKVRERELEKLKEADSRIVAGVMELDELVSRAEQDPSLLEEIYLKVEELVNVIENRNNLFKAEPPT